MKPHKIMIIGCYPPPFGGQSVHVRELHNFLKRRGFDAKVLNIGLGRKTQSDDYITVKNYYDFIAKLCFFSFSGFSFHLHTHGHSLRSWLLIAACGLVTTAFRKNLYLTLHSGICPDYIKWCTRIERALVRFAVSRVNKLIVVNTDIYNCMIALGLASEKMDIIEAFSITEDCETTALSDDLQSFMNMHKPLITCIGFPEPEYGLYLVRCLTDKLIEKYPYLGVIVIGAPRPDGEEQKKSDRAIRWLGLQNRSTSLHLIGQSDLFIRPSFKDGDAISVREALAMSIPVVASDVGHRPTETILFKTGDVNDFALSVEKAICMEKKSKNRSDYINDKNLIKVMKSYG